MATEVAVAPKPIEPCKSGKKVFETEQEALDFEAKNREQYGTIRQYAYACEDCDNYHLTGLSPGSHNVTTNYAKIDNSLPKRRKWTRHYRLTAEEIVQAADLHKKGASVRELANRFGTGGGQIYKALEKAKLSPVPVTVDSLASQEQELEIKLNRIREEKQRRIEASCLKVARLNDGRIQIKKESQLIILPEDECVSLTTMLEEILTAQATA